MNYIPTYNFFPFTQFNWNHINWNNNIKKKEKTSCSVSMYNYASYKRSVSQCDNMFTLAVYATRSCVSV